MDAAPPSGRNAAWISRLAFLVDAESAPNAAACAREYWSEPYTGRFFHSIADTAHPNEITARDLLAVTMLSVEVPARVAVWMLDDGRARLSELLREIPTDVDIWDAGELLGEDGAAWTLWRELARLLAGTERGNGMGPTTISKVLATKRPRLVPVYDSVLEALLGQLDTNYWDAFAVALADESLRTRLDEASRNGAPEDAPFLRRLDAMLWTIGKNAGGST